MSRIVGEVAATGERGSVVPPPGLDLRATAARMASDEPRATARVAVRPGSGWELRRAATATTADPDREGWSILDVGFSDPQRFADRVTGYGADAVALSPPEAREAVVARRRELAS